MDQFEVRTKELWIYEILGFNFYLKLIFLIYFIKLEA
jgi:hypothetical protein